MRGALATVAILLAALGSGCGGSESAPAEPEPGTVTETSSDEQLDGLPAYTAGYAGWTKLNAEPFDTPGAHNGVKDVYVSATRDGDAYPEGAVVVKSIADEGASGPPRDVAVMRKVDGEWEYVEYRLDGDRYAVLAEGELCRSCHMQAAADDYVFTQQE